MKSEKNAGEELFLETKERKEKIYYLVRDLKQAEKELGIKNVSYSSNKKPGFNPFNSFMQLINPFNARRKQETSIPVEKEELKWE